MAAERLPKERGLYDALGAFFTLYETVAWAGGVCDRLDDERVPSESWPPGLEGLRYVRNIVLHQGADVLVSVLVERGSELGTWVLRSPLGTPSKWEWPPRNEMPLPQSKRGASDYDKHLAGQELHASLERILVDLRDTFG
jgi:hypothetical protein